MAYTKEHPFESDEVKGNKVVCHEDGAVGECRWQTKDFNDEFHDTFILRSEKKAGGYKETIEFTPIGLNLIKGTDLETELRKKNPTGNILEL